MCCSALQMFLRRVGRYVKIRSSCVSSSLKYTVFLDLGFSFFFRKPWNGLKSRYSSILDIQTFPSYKIILAFCIVRRLSSLNNLCIPRDRKNYLGNLNKNIYKTALNVSRLGPSQLASAAAMSRSLRQLHLSGLVVRSLWYHVYRRVKLRLHGYIF